GQRGATGATGATGAGATGATGPAGLSCVDFVINTKEQLNEIAPGTDHKLLQDGAYCFGNFALDPGHRITVPSPRKVELRGHGTSSMITGNVDGPVLLLEEGCTVHAHDFKITNVRTAGVPRAVDSATTEAYFVNFAAFINNDANPKIGECIRVTGGRFFATQLRVSDCATGVSCRGGEVFLVNYDCEDLNHGVSVDATHGGLQWVGGRINAYVTTGVRINAKIESVLIQGVTAISTLGKNDFVKWSSGEVNRASIMGNSLFAADDARGINWTANNLPKLALAFVGNTLNVGTPVVGFAADEGARVNSKANIDRDGLMKETRIITT
ncbi:MAG TPA: hypothetical protein VMG12_19760, partial [Polyangiaceae bacterium]|nr:hypothetical protein [Polyangiaceae bacterium]